MLLTVEKLGEKDYTSLILRVDGVEISPGPDLFALLDKGDRTGSGRLDRVKLSGEMSHD